MGQGDRRRVWAQNSPARGRGLPSEFCAAGSCLFGSGDFCSDLLGYATARASTFHSCSSEGGVVGATGALGPGLAVSLFVELPCIAAHGRFVFERALAVSASFGGCGRRAPMTEVFTLPSWKTSTWLSPVSAVLIRRAGDTPGLLRPPRHRQQAHRSPQRRTSAAPPSASATWPATSRDRCSTPPAAHPCRPLFCDGSRIGA